MQPEKEIISLVLVAGTFLLILLSCVLSVFFYYRRTEICALREIQCIKANFEKELIKTQYEVEEQTFRHISLELHDNVSHFLSLAKLYLTSRNKDKPNELNEKVEASVVLLGHSLEEIRNLSKSLNADLIRNNGLIKTLEHQLRQIEKTGQFQVAMHVSGKTCFLDDEKEIVLFRIVQEALNNIVKHSKANRINLALEFEKQRLFLTIGDNGIGFDVKETSKRSMNNSSGLANIKKRSLLINASAEITSNPGFGTTIRVITPY